MLLLLSCLFIMLFSYLMFAVYLVIIRCTLFICTSSPLYTHSPGRFLTTLDLHVQILDALLLLCRYSMRLYALRGTGRSLFWFWYSFLSLFLLLLFDSCISPLAYILFLISFQIMCSLYLYYCSDYWLLWFRFIACSGYFRLNVYMWGIFLAYIRRRLSSRLRFRVFWEAGRDTNGNTNAELQSTNDKSSWATSESNGNAN